MSLSIDREPSQSIFGFFKSFIRSIFKFFFVNAVGRPKVAKVTVTVSSPTPTRTDEKITQVSLDLADPIIFTSESDIYPVSLRFTNGSAPLNGAFLPEIDEEVKAIEFQMNGTPLSEFENDTTVNILFNGNLYPENEDVPFAY